MIRALVVDDQRLVREGLTALLKLADNPLRTARSRSTWSPNSGPTSS